MNVLGIIAEYNPFHQGHAYQIQTLKEKTQADYVIAAMSGNFVQRGAPAMLDKYSRTRMALSCGVDLVLELPVLYACASAEYFARGGVFLLEGTGVVTHLGFGTETEQFDFLQETSNILNRQPEDFRRILQQELKKGLSFPAARTLALKACFTNKDHSFSAESERILASPNNILAIEYLKALTHYHSQILPCPLLRQGAGYHDIALTQNICSASAIRTHIKAHAGHWAASSPVCFDSLPADTIPEPAFLVLKNYPRPFLFEDDFSMLLHYKLLTESEYQLSRYADVSSDLARRLKKEIGAFLLWSSFCEHLKTKNITYSHLSRVFLHILLEIRKEDYQLFSEPSYLRVLGFRREAAPLLTAIQRKGRLPLVTSLVRSEHTLSDSARRLLSWDLNSSNLYRVGITAQGDNSLKNDYRQPIVCL